MKSAVIVFPGINRERDMARALKLVSGREPAMVWHGDTRIAGGHRSRRDPRRLLLWRLSALRRHCGARADHGCGPRLRAKRRPCSRGLQRLPDRLRGGPAARRADAQRQLRFICRDVYLRVERSDTPFTRGYNAGQVIRVPVAHGEGNYIADGETVARLEGEGRVLFRYSSPDGIIDPNWNHNGAMNAIAGIVNARGNVLGMMPHPENHVEAAMGCTDGRGLFAGLTDYFKQAA